MITKFKMFERNILSDIPNIDKIKNQKLLEVIEFYINYTDERYLELNIPIDVYFKNTNNNKFFSNTYIEDSIHFIRIGGMWMSRENENFNVYYDWIPEFYIDVFSDTKINNKNYDNSFDEYEERFIVGDNRYTSFFIDIIYDYIKSHPEITASFKYNL